MKEDDPYVIEKSVPFPSRGFRSIYPWTEMEVGDSFFIPCDELDPNKSKAKAYTVVSNQNQVEKGIRKYAARSMGNNSGVRIWRIK